MKEIGLYHTKMGVSVAKLNTDYSLDRSLRFVS